MLDATDRKILELLQADARMPNTEIAKQVDLVPSAVLERIRRLEKKGVIEGYGVRVNPKALGQGLAAYIAVRSTGRVGAVETAQEIAKLPQVLEVHLVAGEDCLLVKVRSGDTDDLTRLLRERFGKIRSIESTRTTIVLDTIKETFALPIAAQD
ncbi:MAG TPA: Lrp/AsnC family transcriptional regulator [Gammaproteobacteria bacterium]|nr:Lrp/AsnC family transcriptional regulator [Gammaproteobacteria bacterium]